MPTSLVTGGAGFIGSHLCDFLLDVGHRVICVDNLDTGSLQNIEHIEAADDFRFVTHDLTEPLSLADEIDFVFHLASPASPIDYSRLPLHTLKVGSYGTHHMLGLAKFKRARFLLASTSEVYGDPLVHPQPETYWGNVDPIGPRGVYDEAKRYAEALVMAYHGQQGVDTCIARIFNTYGPRMRPHDGRALTTFMHQARANEPLTVFGDGSQIRSFCYVDDLVRGLLLLTESGEHAPDQPGERRPADVARARGDRHSSDGIEGNDRLRISPVGDPLVRLPDITRARTRLGWEPAIKLEDGLSRVASSVSARHGRDVAEVPELRSDTPASRPTAFRPPPGRPTETPAGVRELVTGGVTHGRMRPARLPACGARRGDGERPRAAFSARIGYLVACAWVVACLALYGLQLIAIAHG